LCTEPSICHMTMSAVSVISYQLVLGLGCFNYVITD